MTLKRAKGKWEMAAYVNGFPSPFFLHKKINGKCAEKVQVQRFSTHLGILSQRSISVINLPKEQKKKEATQKFHFNCPKKSNIRKGN